MPQKKRERKKERDGAAMNMKHQLHDDKMKSNERKSLDKLSLLHSHNTDGYVSLDQFLTDS